jgi:hypothetical protein
MTVDEAMERILRCIDLPCKVAVDADTFYAVLECVRLVGQLDYHDENCTEWVGPSRGGTWCSPSTRCVRGIDVEKQLANAQRRAGIQVKP